MNRRKTITSQTKLKGVSQLRSRYSLYYRVQIPRCVIFKNRTAAKIWYDIISEHMYGKFACNNNTKIPEETKKLIDKNRDIEVALSKGE